jgi:hypothetical protein
MDEPNPTSLKKSKISSGNSCTFCKTKTKNLYSQINNVQTLLLGCINKHPLTSGVCLAVHYISDNRYYVSDKTLLRFRQIIV